MKKTLGIVLTVMLLMLVGCADHYPEYAKHQAKVDDDNKALVAAYFGATATRDGLVMQALSDKADPTAMVLYSFLQGQRDAGLVTAFKSKGLVAPKTSMDVWDTFMRSTAPTIARWGFGYLIASDLLDALGAGMSVGGDYVSMHNDSGGGDLTTDFDYTTTDTDYSAGDDISIESLNDYNN